MRQYIGPKNVLLFCDRLKTDTGFVGNNNLKSLFAKTGIFTYDDIINMINIKNSDIPYHHLSVPDYYLKSLSVLNKCIHLLLN